ncbi:unnamed protein product, partial [Mesorhabditis spiculigera]
MSPPRALILLLPIFFNGIHALPPHSTVENTEVEMGIGHSTTLQCNALTNSSQRVIWFKDGAIVAKLNSTQAAIYLDRPPANREKSITFPGSLTIRNATLDDAGKYWCQEESSGTKGDVYEIKLAYVKLHEVREIRVKPTAPKLGQRIAMYCPNVTLVGGPALLYWNFDGVPVNWDNHDGNLRPYDRDRMLVIEELKNTEAGVFECFYNHWTGPVAFRMRIQPMEADPAYDDGMLIYTLNYNNAMFRHALLCFITICLVASAFLLTYVLVACCRRDSRLTFWPQRVYSSLGPGFRKPIFPQPDYVVRAH